MLDDRSGNNLRTPQAWFLFLALPVGIGRLAVPIVLLFLSGRGITTAPELPGKVELMAAALGLGGMPVLMTPGVAAMVMLSFEGQPLFDVAMTSISGINSATFLAVPFFVMAAFMQRGGIARIIIDAAEAWVGHFRDGLGLVCVLSSIARAPSAKQSAAAALRGGDGGLSDPCHLCPGGLSMAADNGLPPLHRLRTGAMGALDGIRRADAEFNMALQRQESETLRERPVALYQIAARSIEDRKTHPQDPGLDPVSNLLAVRVEGAALPDDQILGALRQFLLVGFIAPTTFIGSMDVHLARYPGHHTELTAPPDLVPVALEELLRLYALYRGSA